MLSVFPRFSIEGFLYHLEGPGVGGEGKGLGGRGDLEAGFRRHS